MGARVIVPVPGLRSISNPGLGASSTGLNGRGAGVFSGWAAGLGIGDSSCGAIGAKVSGLPTGESVCR